MSDELARLRSLLGASTGLWSGGTRIEPDRWLALSGAPSVDYNVILCHSPDGQTMERSREEMMASGAPGLIMVAGPALGEIGQLAGAGWVCVGSVPFMTRPLEGPTSPHDHARPLRDNELGSARDLIDVVYGIGPELAQVAFSDEALAEPGREAWGAFDDSGALVACLAAVRSEEAVCIWSMATAVRARRRGHGGRLLSAALAGAAAAGATRSLLHASPDGEPFYAAHGYVELERWQLWSRPRWVLGRV